MMAGTIVVDPITRIEGHLKLTAEIDSAGVVQQARCHGEMFRGIEKALEGKDARTAQQITQRTCGVCPYAHAEAASKALEQAMGIRPNHNGQLLRNLIVAPHFLYDYLLHFYTLSALDFIDVTAVLKYTGQSAAMNQLKAWVATELKNNEVYPAAPFLPRYEAAYASDQGLNISAIAHYLEALDVMRDLHKMVAIFGAKSPHVVAIEAGGVTTMPTMANLSQYEAKLRQVEGFITGSYLQDVLAVAKAFPEYFKIGAGYGNFLSGDFLPDRDGENPLFAAGAVRRSQLFVL